MLEEICRELNNWFDQKRYIGTFTIKDGRIEADLQDGQFFRIVGSVFNDGVYQYPADGLTDETFDGAVWAMAVPKNFLALAGEIEAWCNDNAEILKSPYTSESYGGYSYSRATGSNGQPSSWRDAFADRLAQWRKLPV